MPPGSIGDLPSPSAARAVAGNENPSGPHTHLRSMPQVTTIQLLRQPDMPVRIPRHIQFRPAHMPSSPGHNHKRTNTHNMPNPGEQSHPDMQVNNRSTNTHRPQPQRTLTGSILPLLLMAILHQVPSLHQATTMPQMADNIRWHSNLSNPSSRGSLVVVPVDQREC